MGIYKAIINHNAEFNNLPFPPVIVNELPNISEHDRESNNDLIYRENTTIYSTTPRCGCGQTNQERRIGVMCPKCGTPVAEVLDGALVSRLWMRPPKGIETNQFLNPAVYQQLSNYFSRSKKQNADNYVVETTGKPKKANDRFNPIQWLMLTDYHPKNADHWIAVMKASGIPRGYTHFATNFSEVLNKLFSIPEFNPSNKAAAKAELIEVLSQHRDSIFSYFLPLIERDLVVVEKDAMSRYMDATVPLAVNAARQLLGIDCEGTELRRAARENRTAKAIIGTAHFIMEYGRNNIGSKQGLLRKQNCATRADNSSRAVITSITAPHRYDELHAPWGVAVGMLRTYLQNYLMRYNFTPMDMAEFLSYGTTNWHPLIEHIFKTVFAQSPDGGLPATFCRNPSLERASIQLMLITKVKADPRDQSYGFSILSVVGCNADFDGDEMSAMVCTDREMVRLLEPLKPHKSCHSITGYRAMSGNFSWPKPAVAAFSSALREEDHRPVTAQMDEFLA